MEEYWQSRPKPAPAQATNPIDLSSTNLSEFDRLRHTLVAQEEHEEGWAAELRRYLKGMPADVSKETDIVQWWQVSSPFI